MDLIGGAGPLAALGPMLRTLGVIVIGVGGCMLFGMIGSMTYPGVGAILGAVFGFVLFMCVGCIVLGKYKDIVRGGGDIFDLPDIICEHPAFTLMITVHNCTSVAEEQLCGMGGGKADTFVQIRCGVNPPKSTCVRDDGKWNETFRLNVRSKDKSVICELLDQNVFGDGRIGQVTLDIDDDIIDPDFPKNKSFKVEAEAKSKKGATNAMLSLSFERVDEDYEKRTRRSTAAMNEWATNVEGYGTVAPNLGLQGKGRESLAQYSEYENLITIEQN